MLPGVTNALQALGARVRQLRLAQGLTQESLTAACGIQPNSISAIENGKRDLRITSLFAIAHALRTTAAKLLTGIDPF